MGVRVTFGAMTPPALPKASWGWMVVAHPDNPAEAHLMSLSDIGGVHAFDMECACLPIRDDDPWIIRHNAFDGRLAYETGARKHH